MVTDKRALGNAAESVAKRWLESKGYTALETNFNRRIGEIDLIMQAPENGPVVFVEVRYRTSPAYGGALASVDFRKQSKLRRTAAAWLQKNADSLTAARIDVIALFPAQPDTPDNECFEGYQLKWVINAIEG